MVTGASANADAPAFRGPRVSRTHAPRACTFSRGQNAELNTDIPIGHLASNGVWLTPDDSLGHAVELLQHSPTGAVAVVAQGSLMGLVSDREVAQGLTTSPDLPVSDVMLRDVPVAPANLPAREGLRLLAESPFPALPVALADGRFLGTVGRADLLAALFRRRRPASVGGMATPLGVYLSDGTVRGGTGDLGLALTGAFLFIGSMVSSGLAMAVTQSLIRSGWYRMFPPGSATWLSVAVFLAAFALWFRLSPVAGYHAAEHQTVHAIERNEPLTYERVARMPRPHPRCGTNLAVLFAMFAALVGVWHVDEVLAGLLSLVTYRFFGYWVQLHITTRPATRGQIENGIRAGEQLLERFQRGVAPRRFGAWRRVWNMGLAQVAGGYLACMAVFWVIGRYVPFVGGLVRTLQ